MDEPAEDKCELCGIRRASHESCPRCGYTYCDAQMQMDHHLCAEPTPPKPLQEPLPEWATGHTTAPCEVGAQMQTRDGRRTGNGIVVALDGDLDIRKIRITVITDYGNKVVYNPVEICDSFHSPRWLMEVSTHIGVKKYNDEHPDDRYGKVLDFGVSISGNTISLNWSPITQPNDECPYTHVTAETMFGRFLLTWKGWKEQPMAGASFDETPWGYEPAVDQWDTLEEALVWATMEFVKRIAAGGLS